MDVQNPQWFQPSTSQSQLFVQSMFMPYIEGPKMDWTVVDSLYHGFLKWRLKCENILDCELAMLPEFKKHKKVKDGMEILEWINMCHVFAHRRPQLGIY